MTLHSYRAIEIARDAVLANFRYLSPMCHLATMSRSSPPRHKNVTYYLNGPIQQQQITTVKTD